MKRLFGFTVLLFAAYLMLSRPAWTQAPEKMSYQAVIRNSSDQLVTNHNVGMKISILKGSVTGAPVYEETHIATTNANGLVTIEIGGGTILSGTFADINWASASHFLKVQTDPAGGTDYSITGTSQLLSVPYALRAKTSGLDANSVVSTHIMDASIMAADIADEPGVNWGDSVKVVSIPVTSGELSSISINAPQSGYVIVTVSGWVNWWVTSTGVGIIQLAVSETNGNTDAPTQAISINGLTINEYYRYPFSITRVFAATEGTNTFYFNGFQQVANGDAWVHNHTLVALFVPSKY